MALRRPTRVKGIGAYAYQIRYIPRSELKHESGEVTGICDLHRQIILIANDLSPEHLRENVAHELEHAVLHASFPGYPKWLTLHEEDLVTNSSPVRYQMLRENPGLVAWLTEKTP